MLCALLVLPASFHLAGGNASITQFSCYLQCSFMVSIHCKLKPCMWRAFMVSIHCKLKPCMWRASCNFMPPN